MRRLGRKNTSKNSVLMLQKLFSDSEGCRMEV